MAVGEAILTASFQVMLEKLCSWIPTNVGFVWGIDKELRKLGRTLSKIQAVLDDAEEKQNWDLSVKIWLDELKHVAFDVEDVLDEFAAQVQQSRLEAEAQSDGNQVKNLILYLSKNVVPSKLGIASKIKEITEKLDDIARERDDLGLREKVVEERIGLAGRPKTSSLVDASGVYGREIDKNKIIEMLLEDTGSGNAISVIPIVGMCGIGKTTVAQIVYNDERVKSHFDLRAWACVSEEVDAARITKAILESATRVPYAFDNLDPLQVSLKELLHRKKVLLVLDDVQNDICNEWDVLKVPFRCSMPGSKIIITTTSKVVSSSMGTTPAHRLEGLSDDDCWSLLREHAFTDMNFSTNSNIEEYGREIVKKCGGSPLAAKRFGYLLNSKLNVEEWKDMSTREVWEIQDGKCDIMASLRLTYQKLPAHLKRCFAYCSVFPKYYTFEKETLILLWMAEGLVQSTGRRTMEEVGNEYFQDLLLNSFFVQCGSNKSWFVMHPLFHDLSQFVLGDVCVRCTASDTCVISDKTRYLSFFPVPHEPIKFEDLYVAMSLRSLVILCQDDVDLVPIKQCPYDLFLMLRSLRVLCLTNLPTTDLPDSIGTLKHLRFLDLSNTSITRLPESVSSLYNLQTLLLNDCSKLIELPMDFGNLINLRHLRMAGCDILKKMPDGVGRLTNIQTCSNFLVGKTNGSGVAELGDLLQLRGELTIARLENVLNGMDAMKANMKMKQHLHTLILKWSDRQYGSSRDAKSEEETVNFLQPHVNLKFLVIMSYGGLKFPSWIRLLYNLVKIELKGCRRCALLPPLGHLPLLKYLEISDMNNIKKVGREFCGDGLLKGFLTLEILTFSNMPTWEEWLGVEEGEEFPCLDKLKIENCPKLKGFSCQFPRLRKMVIKECNELISLPRTLQEEDKTFSRLHKVQIWNCPNLLVLPPLFPSLVDLNLKNCQILVLPKLPSLVHFKVEKCNASMFTSIPDLSSLRELCISSITELLCIPKGFFQHLTTLECLRIECCRELVKFENEVGFHLLRSLQRLEILDCPRLLSLPEEQLPTSLRHFALRNCSSLVSFPQALHNLTCLVDLEIHNAPGVASFSEPGLPARLQKLLISRCDKLKLLPKGLCDLSSLTNLYLEYCPCLPTFPEGGLPTTLRLLWIKECYNLRLLPEKMHILTSLQELKVKNCSLLVNFPEEGLPNSLKLLEISECENLQISPVRVLHKLSLLSDLVIDGCPPVLSSLKEECLLPANLEYLTLKQCEGLESLPKGLHNLTSLVSLWINDAPNIASLPEEGLPFSLQELYITASPLLADLCLNEKGKDWPKVAHVPNITIF